MRTSWVLAVMVTLGSLSSTGCYVDGKWQSPSWGAMAWWRKPNDPAPSIASTAPTVTLPSNATVPGRDASAPPIARTTQPPQVTPGAPSAAMASTGPSAYDANRASYSTPTDPSAYPNTGMAAFQPTTGAARANPASYNTAPPSGGGYQTGSRYDAGASQDYVQKGPYATNPTTAVNGAPTQNPMYDGPNSGGAARSTQPYGDANRYAGSATAPSGATSGNAATNATAGANTYVPEQREPRVASRDTAATGGNGPIIPGNTGYNPGNTGYQPNGATGYDNLRNGATTIPSSQPANTWSPGGTGRYQGAAPTVTQPGAAATAPGYAAPPAGSGAVNSSATPNTYYGQPVNNNPSYAQPAIGNAQPAASQPAASRDLGMPDAPARTSDPGRYDGY